MSAADKYTGPWMPAETLAHLPKLRRAFDMNRDPLIAAQLRADQVTEAERRRENSERTDSGGSSMVENDKPFMAHRPPPKMRGGVDREAFSQNWLKAQRDAAMSRVKSSPSRDERGPDHRPTYKGPSR